MLNTLKRWWNKNGDEVAEAIEQAFQAGRRVGREECAEKINEMRKGMPPGYVDKRDALYWAEKSIRERSNAQGREEKHELPRTNEAIHGCRERP